MTQSQMFPKARPASWEKRRAIYTVQITNPKGGWYDHASYEGHDIGRARRVAQGLRHNYKDTPNVRVRVIRKDK